MDVVKYNRQAWDDLVETGNRWTIPVSSEQVEAARNGDVRLLLTPTRRVPASWLGVLEGAEILGLASGGGQQGPLLAAAGARVTIFDNSPRQLEQDRTVAQRESLEIQTELGRMDDLSRFPDDTFDLIFHPISNVFVPQVRPVWHGCHRVLKPGGRLLSGFMNPVQYIFDFEAEERGKLRVRHAIPFSDLGGLPAATFDDLVRRKQPLEFGHSLEDQIGGQTEAGFNITGFYEDIDEESLLNRFIPTFIATRAEKPDRL